MVDERLAAQGLGRPGSPSGTHDRMLDAAGYAVGSCGGTAPTHGPPQAPTPPTDQPPGFGGASAHQGAAFGVQQPSSVHFGMASAAEFGFLDAQLPLRSISDPMQQAHAAAAQQQAWATQQQLQGMGSFQAAASALPPLPPPGYTSAIGGGGGGSQGPEAYSAYFSASGLHYQGLPSFVPGMAPLMGQGYGSALGGGAVQQLPSYSQGPRYTSMMHGTAPYGSKPAQAAMAHGISGMHSGAMPVQLFPGELAAQPSQAYAALPGSMGSWGYAAMPQQQQQQQQQQQVRASAPDGSVRSQLWPRSMGHDGVASLEAAPNNSSSMSGSGGETTSHDSAAGQVLQSGLGSWRSPLDAVQAGDSFRFPPPEAAPGSKALGGAPLSRFAPAPGLPPLRMPPQAASVPAAAEQQWQPQQQQQQQPGQHQPQRQPETASAEHAQQRLRLQAGRPTPQPRGRRKANLLALGRPPSPGGAPAAPQPAAEAGQDGPPAAGAAAAAAAGSGLLDAEEAARALRRHTLLREKNRLAQANARRRKKMRSSEIMDESDATIQELAERVRALEVDTSDLARRNALLQKVAELRRDALPQASGGGASDMQDDGNDQRQKQMRIWQHRMAAMVTCLWRREDNPVTIEETESMDAMEMLHLSEEMKAEMAQSLEAGGRDPNTLAGRWLTELIRHKRIMRPARLMWVWISGESPGAIGKMWIWKPRKPGDIDPANIIDMRDKREVSFGPRTPELWRRTLAAMELSAGQRTAMLGARRRLLGDMAALMRQRERVVGLLAAAADVPPGELSWDKLASDGNAQATQAAEELRGNLDAERAAVIAYWHAVHEELLQPWQEAAGVVAAWPHTIDSLALCNYLAAEEGDIAASDGFDISSLPRNSPFRRFLVVTDDSSSGGDSSDSRSQSGAEQTSTLQHLAADEELDENPPSICVPGVQR